MVSFPDAGMRGEVLMSVQGDREDEAVTAPVSLRGTDGLVTRQWRRSWLVHDIARRQLDCLSRPDHRDGCMAFGDNNLVKIRDRTPGRQQFLDRSSRPQS